MAQPTKKLILPKGIPGAKLETIEREVPASEPPALPVNKELKVIGKKVPRLDGRAKVTGAARYTADVRLRGMLYARMVTAPHPHAKVVSIDTSAAEAYPGIRAVHVIERIQGNAVLLDPAKELPSKYPIVRYAGQPVAAVAAISQRVANEAAKLVKVEYEVLPFVVDMDMASADDAPVVFPAPAAQAGDAGGGGGSAGVQQRGNVRGPAGRPRGDVQKGFAEADVVVEGEYRTQVQTHSAMETHGAVADWRADGLTIYASTQSTVGTRDELADLFGLPRSKVRVVTEYMGGGFGAKFGVGNPGVVAVQLSKTAGAPVKLMLDRHDEHLSVGNRPNSHAKVRIGAKKDGKITAIEGTSWGTAGVGTGAGVLSPLRSMYTLVANVKTEEYDVFTNAGPGAAMRAPGHPQGCFILEQTIDMLAEKLGMDPLALRDLNDENEARRVERKLGAEKFGWSKRGKPGASAGPVKRGIGVAQSVWYRLVDMDSSAQVRIMGDGSVEILSAVQDLGTGIRTVLAQVVAEELGLEPQRVTVHIGDTAFPKGPASGGSMTTSSITPAARKAAHEAKEKMLALIAASLDVPQEQVAFAGGQVSVTGEKAKTMTFVEAAKQMGVSEVLGHGDRLPEYGGRPVAFVSLGGVQFAEVNVDTETGVVKVDRVLAVHDCGRPMNILGIESQINGGILQGISYALYEDRILDRNTGKMVNANLEQYKILGSRETPKIDVHIIEEYTGLTSTDALGIGEPATIPTAAAVANAIYNAIGVRMTELPITPARVLAALAKAREGRNA